MFIAPQRRCGQNARMPAGLPLAIALLAGMAGAAPASEPALAEQPESNAPTQSGQQANRAERCGPAPATIEPGEIFVCAPRPEGYRINPDVMEAKRQLRSGRPRSPERMRDTSCASVGPFGCTPGAGIDLIGAALTAATMASRAARGENVGRMFVTDPQSSEYELYVEAKRIREEKEAVAAAAAKAKAKAAQTPAGK
jgi:hypothetical protein